MSIARRLRVAPLGRMLELASAPLGALLLCGACQQKELFPDMVAPTTAQADAMGWPAPRYFGVEEGDNQDPMVDTPGYPYAGQDWYAQPGYLQG